MNECWLNVSIKTTTSQWSLESRGPPLFTVTLIQMQSDSEKQTNIVDNTRVSINWWHVVTVPTGPNLTLKRTPKTDPRFALGPLRVCFSKICVRFGSTRGSLWVRFGSARSSLCVRSLGGSALHTHAWSWPRSVVTAYKPRPLYDPNTLSSQFNL